jgi:hypothetical protein
MFGSDQMRWPEKIDEAIEAIQEADYLTAEQKRDIFLAGEVGYHATTPEWPVSSDPLESGMVECRKNATHRNDLGRAEGEAGLSSLVRARARTRRGRRATPHGHREEGGAFSDARLKDQPAGAPTGGPLVQLLAILLRRHRRSVRNGNGHCRRRA